MKLATLTMQWRLEGMPGDLTVDRAKQGADWEGLTTGSRVLTTSRKAYCSWPHSLQNVCTPTPA